MDLLLKALVFGSDTLDFGIQIVDIAWKHGSAIQQKLYTKIPSMDVTSPRTSCTVK